MSVTSPTPLGLVLVCRSRLWWQLGGWACLSLSRKEQIRPRTSAACTLLLQSLFLAREQVKPFFSSSACPGSGVLPGYSVANAWKPEVVGVRSAPRTFPGYWRCSHHQRPLRTLGVTQQAEGSGAGMGLRWSDGKS